MLLVPQRFMYFSCLMIIRHQINKFFKILVFCGLTVNRLPVNTGSLQVLYYCLNVSHRYDGNVVLLQKGIQSEADKVLVRKSLLSQQMESERY